MNKGYAFGFLIVLLVLVLGMYVAYTGFVSSREALRARSTLPPSTSVGQATPFPEIQESTATPTLALIATPSVDVTVTLLSETPTVVVEVPPATEAPASLPTEPPPVTPTDTLPILPTEPSTPQAQPPTPVPAPAYQFRLAGPPAADSDYPNCCYIFGTIRDAAGNGLEGVQVQALNEWNTLPPAATKGGAELGRYDIPIGRDVVTWDVVLVDAAGNQISTKVQIQFDPSLANAFRVNWQRTY